MSMARPLALQAVVLVVAIFLTFGSAGRADVPWEWIGNIDDPLIQISEVANSALQSPDAIANAVRAYEALLAKRRETLGEADPNTILVRELIKILQSIDATGEMQRRDVLSSMVVRGIAADQPERQVERWSGYQDVVERAVGRTSYFFWRVEFEIALALARGGKYSDALKRASDVAPMLRAAVGDDTNETFRASLLYAELLVKRTNKYDAARDILTPLLNQVPERVYIARWNVLKLLATCEIFDRDYQRAMEYIYAMREMAGKFDSSVTNEIELLELQFVVSLRVGSSVESVQFIRELAEIVVDNPECADKVRTLLERAERPLQDERDSEVQAELSKLRDALRRR